MSSQNSLHGLAQADPRRHFTQMPESIFLHIASHIAVTFLVLVFDAPPGWHSGEHVRHMTWWL